jgi:hypothetical protein
VFRPGEPVVVLVANAKTPQRGEREAFRVSFGASSAPVDRAGRPDARESSKLPLSFSQSSVKTQWAGVPMKPC